MTRYSEKLLKETIRVWQPSYEDELTTQDAIEILDNTISLFELLDELDRKSKEPKEGQ